MASWYRREIADDARLRMLLELGQVELVKAYLLATEHRVNQEDDEAPALASEDLATLQRLGLWRTLEELITKQLADRARSRRARAKRHVTTRDVTQEHVTTREVTDNTTDQSSLSSSPSEKIQEKPARPSAPRYPVSKRECMKQWNDAVTAVTGEVSCQTSMAMETKAQQFHKAVSAAGETFEDVVRRRVKLGRKLNLHFVMGDYADDRREEAKEKAEQNISPEPMRAPAGALRYMELKKAGLVG